MSDIDICPTSGQRDCSMCSGEYCATHFTRPCNCESFERHVDAAGKIVSNKSVDRTTFQIWYDDSVGEWCITCKVCKMTSYYPKDIEHQYCGNCHQFHSILEAEHER